MTTWLITFQSDGLTFEQLKAIRKVMETIDPNATIKSVGDDNATQG